MFPNRCFCSGSGRKGMAKRQWTAASRWRKPKWAALSLRRPCAALDSFALPFCRVNSLYSECFPFSLKSQGQSISWQGEGSQAGHLQLVLPRGSILPKEAPWEAFPSATAWSGQMALCSFIPQPSRAPGAVDRPDICSRASSPVPGAEVGPPFLTCTCAGRTSSPGTGRTARPPLPPAC